MYLCKPLVSRVSEIFDVFAFFRILAAISKKHFSYIYYSKKTTHYHRKFKKNQDKIATGTRAIKAERND